MQIFYEEWDKSGATQITDRAEAAAAVRTNEELNKRLVNLIFGMSDQGKTELVSVLQKEWSGKEAVPTGRVGLMEVPISGAAQREDDVLMGSALKELNRAALQMVERLDRMHITMREIVNDLRGARGLPPEPIETTPPESLELVGADVGGEEHSYSR